MMTSIRRPRSRPSLIDSTTTSIRCSKEKCRRFLPSNRPSSYTNGLCERHFFSMDFSSSDDETKENQSKSFPKENHCRAQRGDIRETREIFDGHQWCRIDQKIDRLTSTIDKDIEMIDKQNLTKTNAEQSLFQFVRLLTNYQTITEELKKQNEI